MTTDSWTPGPDQESPTVLSNGTFVLDSIPHGSIVNKVSDSTPPPVGLGGSPQRPQVGTQTGKKRKATSITAEERRKTTRACDSCRAKKIKCSGTKPCGRCLRLKFPCEYNASYSRGQPPTPLPPPDGVRSTHGSARSQNPVMRTETPRSIPKSASLQPRENEESLARSSSILSTSPHNSPEPGAIDFEGNYLGPSSGINFLSRAWRRLNEDHGPSVPSGLQDETNQNVSVFSFGDRPFQAAMNTNIVLPSKDAAKELISIFFDFAVVTYRLLHRPTLETWVSDLYELGAPLMSRVSNSVAGRAAVVFNVFAVARLHQEHGFPPNSRDANTSLSSEHWFKAADYMLSIETGPPKIETIQAKYIQCLYLLSSSRANQSWYTFGTTIQLITALGIHRKRAGNAPREDNGYIHNELRKRLFWAAYPLDKYLSVMLGRPRHLHDEDIDQEFPDEVNDEDMTPAGPVMNKEFSDCATTAFIFHAKLSRIVGEISREVYAIHPVPESRRLEAAQRLTRDLDAWKDSLPPLLSSIRPSSLVPPFRRQSNVLRLAYAHAIIHATRYFLLSDFSDLRRRTRSTRNEQFEDHVQKCVKAAQSVVELANSLADSDEWPLFQAYWFTHYASFSAIIVLYVYTTQKYRLRNLEKNNSNSPGTGDDAADSRLLANAERCQRHLAEATRENCPSRRYSIILEELRLDVHREVDTHPSPLPSAEQPVPSTRNGPSAVAYHELNLLPISSVQPGTYTTNNLPVTRSSDTSYDGQIPPNFTDPLIGVAHQPDFSYDMSFMDWAQLDSWAFSNTADDHVVPGDWLVR